MNIRIRYDIPMPSSLGRRGPARKYDDRLRTMKVGGSFLAPRTQRGNMYRLARQAGIVLAPTLRECPAGKCRVFRVR